MTIDKKIITATIITTIANAIKYKALIQAAGGTIEKEVDHSDGSYVFLVKNLDALRLKLFNKNNASDCYVHYYEATMRNGKYKIRFYTADTSTEKKHIQTAEISYIGGEKVQKICEIFSRRDIGVEKPSHYTINWGAWGSMDIDTTKFFAEGIQVAIEIAEYCTAKFTK